MAASKKKPADTEPDEGQEDTDTNEGDEPDGDLDFHDEDQPDNTVPPVGRP